MRICVDIYYFTSRLYIRCGEIDCHWNEDEKESSDLFARFRSSDDSS